jgi:hypothetical protein
MLLKIEDSEVSPFLVLNSLRRFEEWLCLRVQKEVVEDVIFDCSTLKLKALQK